MAFKFGDDLMVQATWLYYVEQRTQAEIADVLGVSRASVANYLSDARRRGFVQISVEPHLLARLRQAEALQERHGLEGVYVAPPFPADGPGTPSLRQRIGMAAAQVLVGMIGPESVLGVAWGRTMAAMAETIPSRALPDVTVVQVSGSSLGDEASSPEHCTLQIAARLGARCQNFHAPAVVSAPDLRDALMQEPPLARHFERIRSCDCVVFGVGELTEQTRWADGDWMIRPAAETYRAQGSVGILIGRFIDDQGREVPGPLSRRQIGMDLSDLRAVPKRLCVAGGAEKLAAIRASLAGGYVTHLVTDTETADLLQRA